MLDLSTRLTPFIGHNDVTRMQMAAVQVKQTIPLINPQIPFIRTGWEESYLDYSSYFYKAKASGSIVYKDDEVMVVKYDTDDGSNDGEIINLGGPYGNREGFERRLYTRFKLNDKFNKDDILAHHATITEDGFLSLGSNLVTTYISCPYNYRDALVVSESCAQKMSTRIVHQETIDCDEQIPILWNHGEISYPQGTFVNKADTIFILQEKSPNNPMNIVSSGTEIHAPVSGKLYYKIIVDEIVKTQNEESYYKKVYDNEIARENLLAKSIDLIYNINNKDDIKQELLANAYKNYYCPQLGVRRSGKTLILIYYIVQECPLIVGCKLCNRHGNKGVISKIYADKDMPRDQNGVCADIIVSSMSITTRMNVGQLFELHLNRANHLYTTEVLASNDTIDNKIEKLYNMISEVQPHYLNKIFKETAGNWSFEEKANFIKRVAKHNVIEMVQPPFTKFDYNDCVNFCKKYGKMDESLKEPIMFNNELIDASFGHTYWYRLEHEPNKKYFARSVGVYGKIGQPSRSNGSNKGAHRIGELETWALLAHQAYENLLEFFVSKSDSLSEAARMLKYLFDNQSSKYTPFIQTPGILKVFKTFVMASGYDMLNSADSDIDLVASHNNTNQEDKEDIIINEECSDNQRV